jgi:hypothetical protein
MTTSTGSAGPAGVPERPIPGNPATPEAVVAPAATSTGEPGQGASFDPLRLCIYTTVALITWIAGPFAVLVFAGLGLAGYWRAHQAGLTRTKCYLRDVRLVLLYLGAIALIAAAASVFKVHGWFG